MSTRSSRGQSAHDNKVKSLAENLERQGFNVAADIPGYSQPKAIGGLRPDIIGTKRGERRIYEVETPESADTSRDQKQQEVFRKAAEKSDTTTFKRFLTK